MKAQLNIEFIVAAGLFLIVIGVLMTSGQVLPSYSSEMDRLRLEAEAETISAQLLRSSGSHSFAGGGDNWEENSNTISNIEAVGLASDYHVIERDKIDALKTTTLRTSGRLNYTKFQNLTGAENQFRFRFVWHPTVNTYNSFTKGNPPSDPPIVEPEQESDIDGDGILETTSYGKAENEIHYGSIDINRSQYNVLATAHDNSYDSLYVSESDWNFQNDLYGVEPYGESDRMIEVNFTVENFQNLEDNKGSNVIWKREIGLFGPSPARNTEVITIDRFGIMEGEPLRIEVTSW